MYRYSRSAVVAQGKGPEAVEFAVRIAAHVTAHHNPVAVAHELAGNPDRIHWFSEYENLTDWERVGDALRADDAYRQMLIEAGSLFVAGATKDSLLRILPPA